MHYIKSIAKAIDGQRFGWDEKPKMLIEFDEDIKEYANREIVKFLDKLVLIDGVMTRRCRTQYICECGLLCPMSNIHIDKSNYKSEAFNFNLKCTGCAIEEIYSTVSKWAILCGLASKNDSR